MRHLTQVPATHPQDYLCTPVDAEPFSYFSLSTIRLLITPLRVYELANILALDLDAAEGGIPRLNEDWLSAAHQPSLAVHMLHPRCRKWFPGSWRLCTSTINETLMSPRLNLRYRILRESAHTIIVQACLGDLLYLVEDIDEEITNDSTLTQYSAQPWLARSEFESMA